MRILGSPTVVESQRIWRDHYGRAVVGLFHQDVREVITVYVGESFHGLVQFSVHHHCVSLPSWSAKAPVKMSSTRVRPSNPAVGGSAKIHAARAATPASVASVRRLMRTSSPRQSE